MTCILTDSSEYLIVRSSVTGRELIVNKSETCFLIPPGFSPANLHDAVTSFLSHNEQSTHRLRGQLKQQIELLLSANNLRQFENLLHEIIDTERFGDRPTDAMPRLAQLMAVLWHHDCLIWPRCYKFKTHILMNVAELRLGRLGSLLEAYDGADRGPRLRKALSKRVITQFALSVGGFRESGDLTGEAADGRLKTSIGRVTAKALVDVIYSEHSGTKLSISINDYGPFGWTRPRSDNAFNWATERDPSMESWRAAAAEYLPTVFHSRGHVRTVLALLLDGIIADKAAPRRPLDLLRTICPIPQFLVELRTPNYRTFLHRFFDWYLDKNCVAEADDGFPYRVAGFRNPITLTRSSHDQLPAETIRDALPTRYIRIFREVLEENDFAWARTYGKGTDRTKRGSDYFSWRNPETDEWEEVWCPVRAMAILLKLELPLRSFQVRMLNSGESDPESFDMAKHAWIVNEHPLSKASVSGRPMGALRKLPDVVSGRAGVGIYVNTNKTADIHKDEKHRGYVIPWENPRAIKILSDLRQWQERYNPIRSLTPVKSQICCKFGSA